MDTLEWQLQATFMTSLNPSASVPVLMDYDPNGVGSKTAGIFGLPIAPEDAAIVIIPVPWEVTVSYGAGTARGPQAVLDAVRV
jgi:agmatinase